MRFGDLILTTALTLMPGAAHAECLIGGTGERAGSLGDALAKVLEEAGSCPENAFELRSALREAGLALAPAMVANRGFHNPRLGSFSIFEMATGTLRLAEEHLTVKRGDFFFGHFTRAFEGEVRMDQSPSRGKLMVELIAWDPGKGVFNFYELIGTGGSARWFYRGDSRDALADNRYLYREPPAGEPKFGDRMRCSGCHVSGGPIMKELAPPHNAWWTEERPLGFGANEVGSDIEQTVREILPASDFADAVRSGMTKLEGSPEYKAAKAARSLQERLRPLFCETEINLASSPFPGDGSERVEIPSGFWVNERLASGGTSIPIAAYRELLDEFRMRFPETGRRDADHSWLVPVKGEADQKAIATLIASGAVNREFVADVLAVDYETPLFSPGRCGLLAAVPATNEHQSWRLTFRDNLRELTGPSSVKEAATELLRHLENPAFNKDFHQREAGRFLGEQRQKLETPAGRREAFRRLLRVRDAVSEAEISQNPRGQILEPGFRVIFPQTSRL